MESSRKLAVVLLLALLSATIVTAQNTPKDMVDAHNAVRASVGVGPVSWNTTVATYAKAYAEKRRADCQLVLSPEEDRPYGENIFRGSGSNWTAVDVVNWWASGKQYYNNNTNTCSAPTGQSCGQYTQVVWRNSTAIGCAGVVCDGAAGVFVICSYSPPGNEEGQTPYSLRPNLCYI